MHLNKTDMDLSWHLDQDASQLQSRGLKAMIIYTYVYIWKTHIYIRETHIYLQGSKDS